MRGRYHSLFVLSVPTYRGRAAAMWRCVCPCHCVTNSISKLLWQAARPPTRLGETFLRPAPSPSLPGQVTPSGCPGSARPCPALPGPARPGRSVPARPAPLRALPLARRSQPGRCRPWPGRCPQRVGRAVPAPRPAPEPPARLASRKLRRCCAAPSSLSPSLPAVPLEESGFFLLSGSVNQLHLKSRKCKSITSSSEPPATPCVSQTAELPVPFLLCGAARVSPCLRGKSRSGICSRSQRFLPRLL